MSLSRARWTVDVKRNIVALSLIHCCSGKGIRCYCVYCWATFHCQKYKIIEWWATVPLRRTDISCNNKSTQVFIQSAQYLCPIVNKFGVSREVFIQAPT